MSRTLNATIGALALITAVGFAAPLAPPDYTSLPPEPAEVEKQLHDAKVSLAQAIDTAQKEVNGVAKSATMNLAAAPTIEVNVYAGGKNYLIVVDGVSGAVISKVETPRFPGDLISGDLKKTASGLMYYDFKEGTGAQPSGPAATVVVNYTVWFNDGTKLQSSLDTGQPAQLPLGQMIPGWIEGVGSMKVGGKRKLIIPPNLAWGDMGRPPQIPGKATVIFDVELLNVIEPPSAKPPAPPTTQPK